MFLAVARRAAGGLFVPPHTHPSGAGEENRMSRVHKTIKWRLVAPAYRAAATAGTVVALVATVGAPWKWR